MTEREQLNATLFLTEEDGRAIEMPVAPVEDNLCPVDGPAVLHEAVTLFDMAREGIAAHKHSKAASKAVKKTSMDGAYNPLGKMQEIARHAVRALTLCTRLFSAVSSKCTFSPENTLLGQ